MRWQQFSRNIDAVIAQTADIHPTIHALYNVLHAAALQPKLVRISAAGSNNTQATGSTTNKLMGGAAETQVSDLDSRERSLPLARASLGVFRRHAQRQ